MLKIDMSHFDVKYSILISCGLSLIFSLIYFPTYLYQRVSANTIFLVNVVPVLIFVTGLIKNWNENDKNILSSIFYSLVNMFLSTFVVIFMMIVFFFAGILYM